MTTTTNKPLSKAAQKKADQVASTMRLREWIKPGDTVYTSLKHVSKSGMSRRISVYIVRDGVPENISGMVSDAIGVKWNDDGSVSVSGCGMDMGFHIVYTLSYYLFPKGFECIGSGGDDRACRCPSNDHSNGDRNYQPHNHSDGGYALRHRWM